jgi:hypothetical protein
VPFGERRVGVVPGDAGFEPGLDQGVGLQMDDDANRAADIAALGARDAASAPVRPFETVSGSHIRRHGLRRRRERVQTENPRHRRRFRAPRAPRPQHEGGNRREGMTVDLPQIDGPACAAAWAEHVKPGRLCDRCGPDGRRPQHVPASGELIIPALDDGLSFGTRGSIGNLPLGIDGDVQAPCPHAHRGSIAESIRLIKWRNASS